MVKSKVFFVLLSIIFVMFITSSIVWQTIDVAPSPRILGCSNIYHLLGDEPPNLLDSIEAYDYKGRDLASNITVLDEFVDWERSGVYELAYIVKDRYGKVTEKLVLLYIIPQYPYFEGLEDIYCITGATPNYLSLVDAFDGFGISLKDRIVVENYEVNTNEIGEYRVFYRVEDDYGFWINEQIKLFILEDFLPVFEGESNIEYLIGTGHINYMEGVKAYDYKARDITHLIEIDDSQVNLNAIGYYKAYLYVKDSENNTKTKEITVTVRDYEEEDYPKINGIVNYSINLGSTVPDWSLGISAYDQYDHDLTDCIIIDSSAVDIDIIGIYYVYYSVTNSKGLEYNGVSRVEVHEPIVDITSPELIGTKDITYSIGDPFPNYLEGVSAIDDFDGDISDLIMVDDSLVDYVALGVYQVVYSIADSSDNTTIVYINVTVVDTTPPIIFNAVSMTYYIGDLTPDYITGVTARDNVDGDLTPYIEVDDSEVDYLTEGYYNVKYFVYDLSGNMGEYFVIIEVICSQI